MNESTERPVLRRAIPVCFFIGAMLGLAACSDDASLGKKPTLAIDNDPQNMGGTVDTGMRGGAPNQPSGGAAGTATQAGAGGAGAVDSVGAGGVGESGGGAAAAGGSDGGDGVVLTALYLPGSGTVAAEWYNGTDATIFLRGCSTTDGWYREGGDWLEYGAFAVCAMEGPEVEVAPGETYRDPAAGVPPARGDNVWRLVGPYGTGCTPGVRFSEANCAELFETTSVNEVPN
jgi:hypothetical protein